MAQLLTRGVVTRASDKPNNRPKPSRFDLVAPPFPLNHARILYNNVLLGIEPATSSGQNGLDSSKPNSFERWTFTGTAQAIFTLPANQNIDTICIGAHNLKDATVRVYYDVNGGGMLRHLGSVTPDTNAAIMFHFDSEYSAKRISVKVESSSTHFVGYISAGIALQLQRPFFSGHTPITDSEQSKIQHNRTQSGDIVGSSLVNVGIKTDVSLNNIDPQWFDSYFHPFKISAKVTPFFFAWNLLEYPQDVGFCRIPEDINGPFSGVRDLIQFDFTLLGV